MSLAAIILCAGNGARMNSDLPKVLHKLAGFPLIHHVMNTVQELGVCKTVIVAGKGIDKVSQAAFDFNDDRWGDLFLHRCFDSHGPQGAVHEPPS